MNEETVKIMESRHIRPTSIRILVLKTMLGFDWAFSLADLETKLESVDKSTISRTIHLFHDHQLIHSFDDGSGSIKYAVCSNDCLRNFEVDDLHAHFYCNYCKKAFCLNNVRIPQFDLPPEVEIESVNLVLKGYCGKCSKIAT
jgi:Fur family ferric uptake transcriptional regulator